MEKLGRTGGEQGAMAGAFKMVPSDPQESQAEEPLGWNQGKSAGLYGRKLFGGGAQSNIRD